MGSVVCVPDACNRQAPGLDKIEKYERKGEGGQGQESEGRNDLYEVKSGPLAFTESDSSGDSGVTTDGNKSNCADGDKTQDCDFNEGYTASA